VNITSIKNSSPKKQPQPVLWYPLIKPKMTNIKAYELESEARKLVERYLTRTKVYLFKDPFIKESEYRELVRKELLGRQFLRMAASKHPKLVDWLIEFEGDEFYTRFEKAPKKEKIIILRVLFGEQNVLTKEEFKEKFGIDVEKEFGITEEPIKSSFQKIKEKQGNKTIYRKSKKIVKSSSNNNIIVAIRFEYVPTIVSERRALLFKGWVISPLARFRGEIKKTFEMKLRKEILKIGEKLEKDPELNMMAEKFAKELLSIVKTTSYSGFDDLGRGAYNQVEYYPPCAYDLRMTLEESGYLPHNERLQLGLILKKLGMDVETQLRFWYERAVDNSGLTYEQFLSKAGYQIKHLYGLVGSGTDYDAPKCETIISSMYCTFKNRDLNSLQESIKSRFKGKVDEKILSEKIDKIISLSHSGKYRYACAVYLSLITGKNYEKPINHPLFFFKLASNSKKALKKKTDPQLEEENKQDTGNKIM